jgi:hypothetical protein
VTVILAGCGKSAAPALIATPMAISIEPVLLSRFTCAVT